MRSKSMPDEDAMSESNVTETRAFDLDQHSGEIGPSVEIEDLAATVVSLVEPTATSETLHWGRNYLYGARLPTAVAEEDVVVKQFRNQGFLRRWQRRRKGSKAWRSWRASLALQRAGIATPAPLLWIESRDPEGPSFFVSRRLPEFLEARYYFRALEAGTESEDYPGLDAAELIEKVALTIRRLHDHGIWHRDLSIGNVLLAGAGQGSSSVEVHIIDLNRVRFRRHLTTLQRTRDLTRLRIFRSDLQDRFVGAYWGEDSPGLWRKRLLYQVGFRGFLWKVRLKEAFRKPFRGLRDVLKPRHPHVHIPQAPEDASTRDRAVWDGLSDQPHQHATRLQRLAVRLRDAPLHGRETAAGIGAMPRIRRRYAELKAGLYRQPVTWPGMGIALRPWPENPEALLRALEQSGTRQVILRLHPWQDEHHDEEQLATELHRRGLDLAFVLPQNRNLVRDLERWRASVTELADRFGRFGRHFQIGQAVNRSKWGIWNYKEYLGLASVAAEVLRQDPRRRLMGPAVIDYEPLRTAGILNIPQNSVRFDILASLLYVDRRGAPENKQLGFDTVDKVTQLKAIAETAPSCGGRSWITEVNWPLWEGPHSPAGRKVSVDEERQANYLARYYLLTLGTGLVERVYWWQLVARGYGLGFEMADGSLQTRPSFRAFANLQCLLDGASFQGTLPCSAGARLYHFHAADGTDCIAGWSADDAPTEVELPRPVSTALSRDGQELTVSGETLTVDGAPRYLQLEPE